jgi:methyl-accepting chemotaxis protein
MNFSKENNQKCVHECMEQLKTIIDDYKKHNELDVSMRTLYLSVSQIIENREHIEQTNQEIKESKQLIEESNQWIEENKQQIKESKQLIEESNQWIEENKQQIEQKCKIWVEQGRRIDALEELATFEKFNDQLLKAIRPAVRHFSEFSRHFKTIYNMDLKRDSLILKVQFNHVKTFCSHW